MAQLKIKTDDFNLSSSWVCSLVWSGESQSWKITTGPSTSSKTVTFSLDDLGDVTITSARIYATLGSPLTGADIRTVNGVSFKSNDYVDIVVNPGDTSVTAVFKFKANGAIYEDVSTHESSQSYSNVYLLIEYELNYTKPDLIEYTDAEPVQGETYVKAIHMTELHTNVNLIRVARKLADYIFTPIIAMETGLGGWNNHVVEIRSAIDEMNLSHEDWIELGENYPRLDVLLQLRRVVQAVSEP